MKKFFLTLALLAVTALNSFGADGAINFRSIGSDALGGSVNAFAFNVDGTTKLSGTGFSVQLFYGALGATDNQLVAVGPIGSFLTGGGSGYFAFVDAIVLPGISIGSQARIQARAWDNAGGTITSFANALVRGSSASFNSPNLGDPFVSGSIPVPVGLTSFQLAAVPEPTTIALGVLGGLGLLARRRRNA
jgi:hypothetical protein